MAEKKKTSAQWIMTHPYNPALMDSPDGWDRKNLYQDFNVLEITEVEFRARLKKSNVHVPDSMSTDFEKAKTGDK